SIPASVTLAFVRPYGSISSSWSPRSWATSMIGRGVTERAISRSVGKLIEPLGSWRRRPPRRPPAAQRGQARFDSTGPAPWPGRGRRGGACGGRILLAARGSDEAGEQERVGERPDAARHRGDRGRDPSRGFEVDVADQRAVDDVDADVDDDHAAAQHLAPDEA